MRIFSPTAAAAALLALTALGGCGGGSGGTADNDPSTAAAESGVFVDSPVAGIGYRTASRSGTTDAGGRYDYLPGETVTFFVGNVSLPPVTAKGTVTPFDIARSSDSSNPVALNVASFLQSLDTDGDPANGITIPAAAAGLATGGIDFNVPTTTFAQNAGLIALVRDANPGSRTPVDADTARAHLLQSMNRLAGSDRPDLAPIARVSASADTVPVGQGVVLTATDSEDPNGDPLRFRWSLTVRPDGSQIALPQTSTDTVTLTPDVTGRYVVALVVSDDGLESEPVQVEVVATAPFSPPPATLTGLSIVGVPAAMAVGGTHRLSATASYSDQTTADVTAQATWSSSDPAVLSVSEAGGALTAISAGSAQITAGFGGATASPVTVPVVVLAAPHLHLPVSSGDSGAADGTVTLAWTDVPGAETYTLYWLADTAGVTSAANRIDDVQSGHVHTGLTGGTSYSYRVAAVLGDVEVLSEEVFSAVYRPGPASGSFSSIALGSAVDLLPAMVSLQDGRVLIAGNGFDTRSPAILFDPATDTADTISLGAGVLGGGAAATRLPDGKVMLFGGIDHFSQGASEFALTTTVFDPQTNTFAAGPSMPEALAYATATTLLDGRVLLAGGVRYSMLAATRIYDPLAASFADGPAMNHERYEHPAVRLRDGSVLVIGGDQSVTTERFDPSVPGFSVVGSPSAGGLSVPATLLTDGRVLFLGSPTGEVVTAPTIFDPQTNTFATGGALTTPRSMPAVTTLADGRVLIAGGNDGTAVTTTAEIYDPVTGQSTPTGSMPHSNTRMRSVLLRDGRVLIANLSALLIYQP